MAKARDHVGANEVEVRWRAGEPLDLVYGSAPAGLESVVVDEAKSCGLGVRKASPGLLQFPRIHPAGLLARLRCLYDIRLLVATGQSLNAVPPSEVPRRLADLLANSEFLRQWRASIETSDETLRYRFALEGLQLPKSTFRETLAAVRAALQAHGLADSPSRYAALLRIEVTSAATKVWFVPTFERDVRFDYRKADVGASISPVIGACLVRLMRIGAEGTIVDPTCGSGTLLIERALLDDGVKLVGIDVSPTAVRAAGENVAAARLQPRIAITLGDATDPAKWPQRCSEVIANLPFGARSAAMDRDLKTVYREIVSNIAARLDSGGRALLYTANARLLEPEIESHRDRLQLIETRVITAGGMSVRVWLLRGR
jgi:23S rRNA G2445 N2-methylase RlmL